MPGTIAAAVAGSVISGVIAKKSQDKAINAQTSANDAALRLQEDIFNTTQENTGPYREAGENALAALMFDLGLSSDRPRLPGSGTFQGENTDKEEVFNRNTNVQQVGAFSVGNKDFVTREAARAHLDKLIESGDLPNIPRIRRTPDGKFMVGKQAFNSRDEARVRLREVKANRGLKVEKNPGTFKVGQKYFENEADAQEVADRRFEKAGGKFYEGFTKTPGYDFRLGEGVKAIEGSAAARGGLYSGATLKRLTEFGQDYATSEYTNHLRNLFGVTGLGASAAGGANANAQRFADSSTGLITDSGRVRASGALGTGEILNNGLRDALQIAGYAGLGSSTAGGLSTRPIYADLEGIY